MNKLWLKAASIRAIKTMAQTAVALIGTHTVGILEVDWIQVCSASVLAGIVSMLTSVAGLPEVEMPSTIQHTFNSDAFEMLQEVEDYEDTEDSAE